MKMRNNAVVEPVETTIQQGHFDRLNDRKLNNRLPSLVLIFCTLLLFLSACSHDSSSSGGGDDMQKITVAVLLPVS